MSEQAQGHGHGAPRQNVENSHFCLVADSEEAFVLRAATARLAQRTLDLQYYVWEDDRIGKLLVYRALEAARRGVKVRLLLDHVRQSDVLVLFQACPQAGSAPPCCPRLSQMM